MSEQDTFYGYDEEAAVAADNIANRISENAAYVGSFTRVEDLTSQKGTKGVYFEFECPGGGKTNFTLYTKKAEGEVINVGMNKLQAMLTILGLKHGLRAQPGKVQKWDEDEGKRVEADGMVFPDLIGKPIGLVFQKELYTGNDGKDRDRMELVMSFDATSKLSASEIKERKAKPEKLDKVVRGLKTRDNRVKQAAEPSQPAVGASAGDF